MTSFRIEFDLSNQLEELQRLARPAVRVVAGLENALLSGFERSQQDVHVLTGSLRGSGVTNSTFDGQVWSGEIEYGGTSPGFPNSPVVYAGYEQALGGDHDFMANVADVVDPLVQAAINQHLNP